MSGDLGRRETRQRQALAAWAKTRDIELTKLDDGQRWVVFAALQGLAFLGKLAPLRRVVGYLLAHSGMELGSTVIAAVVGVSDRSIRSTQALAPVALLGKTEHPVRGHQRPKLEAKDAGVVAKFLVEHPKAQVHDVLEFIGQALGVLVDRLTLRRFVGRYGLGCLRGEEVEPRPLFSGPRPGVGHFS
jgi:hypothetical protein